MPQYKVKWEISIEAETAQKAAEIAAEIVIDIQKHPFYDSVVFTVDAENKPTETICLAG